MEKPSTKIRKLFKIRINPEYGFNEEEPRNGKFLKEVSKLLKEVQDIQEWWITLQRENGVLFFARRLNEKWESSWSFLIQRDRRV